MPHTIINPTHLPTGVLGEPASSTEHRGPGPVRPAVLSVFDQEVEVDRLSEETLAYKEMLVVLVLILFVLIRSLLV